MVLSPSPSAAEPPLAKIASPVCLTWSGGPTQNADAGRAGHNCRFVTDPQLKQFPSSPACGFTTYKETARCEFPHRPRGGRTSPSGAQAWMSAPPEGCPLRPAVSDASAGCKFPRRRVNFCLPNLPVFRRLLPWSFEPAVIQSMSSRECRDRNLDTSLRSIG